MWKCILCDESYCKRSNYQRHLGTKKHLSKKAQVIRSTWKCNICHKTYSTNFNYQKHLNRAKHRENVLKTDKIKNISIINNNNYELRKIESAFQNRLETFLITNTNDRKKVDNLATFLEGTTDFLLFAIKKQLETKTALLVNLKVCAKFKRITGEEQEFALKTSNIKIFRNDVGLKLNIKINGLYEDLTAELQDLEKKGEWLEL